MRVRLLTCLPGRPRETANVELSEGWHWMVLDGDLAYLSEAGHLKIMDMRRPSSPVVLGQLELSSRELGSRLELCAPLSLLVARIGSEDLRLVDVSDPMAPVKMGGVSHAHLRDFAVVGDHLFVAAGLTGTAGLHVLDISDPSEPREVANLRHEGDGWPDLLLLSGTTLYAQITAVPPPHYSHLRAFNVADPENPIELWEWQGADISSMEPRGDVLWAKSGYGLAAYSTASEGFPRAIGEVTLVGHAPLIPWGGQRKGSVVARRARASVASGSVPLSIIDIVCAE